MTSRLLPFLIIAIAIGIAVGYIHPTYTGSIAQLRTEIKGYDSALAAARMFKEREAELIAERNTIDPVGLERLEAMLPDSVDNVQLFLDLDSLAQRTGMTIQDLDVSDTGSETGPDNESVSLGNEASVDSLELSLTAVGTYAGMRAFLEGTEQSLRLLDLVDISVAEGSNGLYTYDMRFRLYWLR